MSQNKNLPGKQKAAILLLTLGPDLSAEIFQHLSEEYIEDLTLEIANMREVNSEIKDNVLQEFFHLMEARDYIDSGGIQYAREILEKALGEDEARDILERLTSNLQVRPFDSVRKTYGLSESGRPFNI